MPDFVSRGAEHAVFSDLLDGFRETATANQLAALLEAQRVWSLPTLNEWSGDSHDIEGMTSAYDRTEINDNYVECITSDRPGSVGDCTALKLQIEYVAAAERAFRARHCSPIRAMLHSAARQKGHGHEAGIFGNLRLYIKDLIAKGAIGAGTV